MDVHSGNLATDLLDITTRYLNASNLKSFILPLPFCDETILDRRALLVKLLANVSCLAKEQLLDVVQALSTGDSTKGEDNGNSTALNTALSSRRAARNGRNTSQPQTGIRSALRPSASAINEKLMAELSEMHQPTQIARSIDAAIRRLSNPQTVGFVMIIASELKSNDELDKGGVVEMLDPEEHCVRCVWGDPRLVKHGDSEFGKILILRILGHLFDYGYPGAPTHNKLKHTSVLNVHGVLFPSAIYTFMINGLKFGKHFETETNGGSHEDSSSNYCRCQRLAESPDAELFWGISESRLKSTFYNVRTQIPCKPSEQTIELLQKITQG
ncbi:uncharacterized protein BXIN_0022 [Babesia sp. Xinjiang]|uniref:uncharacterized protein n=1 Tax=Babesia sp. Xinjiang TaxID=462227 RepID=UPI000A23D4C2|nr:uncharacterized protein BXIN_0022 [Babesia sp. Xinjiang]ORM39756.1 hypothetical protein BXIN_0022 [Babesia sp. Xinjiang]